MQLNERQKEAVETLDGPVLVVAGAGAGKTRVLTERILNIIKKNKAEPHEILAITFTNKAAKEMRERARLLLDKDSDINRPISAFASGMSMPFISTFHSLGVHIMREQAGELGIKRHFNILDRQDASKYIKNAIKQMGLDPKEMDTKSVLNAISRAKSDSMSPELYLETANSFKKEQIAHIWRLYEEAKKKEGVFDFDDLLLVPLRLLQENDAVLAHYQRVWKYILVDEYQDTNRVQFELLRLLADKHKNIFAVGDIDQSIYLFRGARPDLMLTYTEQFPGTKEIFLEQNYRSTKTIIAAANAVIEKNEKRQEKTLFTKGPEGEPIVLLSSWNAKAEAREVAQKAKELIERGVPAHEIAVLYRMNFVSRVFEEAFLSAGVPYQILGTRFFDRKEVKDLLSFLKLALNRDSLVDLHRAAGAVPRGLGKQTLLKIQEGKISELGAAAQAKVKSFFDMLDSVVVFAGQNKVSDTLKFLLDKSGLKTYLEGKGEDGQERLLNLFELIELSKKYDLMEPEEGLLTFLEEAALAQDQDELEKSEAGVKLMTVHASKGLEFKVVFIVATEQGIFPVERFDDTDDEEEERRLFYVALTRAKEKLFISRALERQVYGDTRLCEPSEFISDIPQELIEDESEADESIELDDDFDRGHNRGVDLIDWG